MSDDALLGHLTELRQRLIRYLTVLLILFLIALFFSAQLYTYLAEPLLMQMFGEQQMIATAITSPIVVPIKLALATAFVASIPILLYQGWSFVAPGLYDNEQKYIWPFLLSSTTLFYLGMIFAYYIVLPLIFKFFIAIAPVGVTVMPDMQLYLSFSLKMLMAFGFAFQAPLITLFLILANIVSIEKMQQTRPYVVVGAFILGMLLTPPDVISQILMAIPLWLLFELGVLIGKLVKTPNKSKTCEKP